MEMSHSSILKKKLITPTVFSLVNMSSLLLLICICICICILQLNCEEVFCNLDLNGDCQCIEPETCVLSCIGFQTCKSTTQTTHSLICKENHNCHVNCDGESSGSACMDSIINGPNNHKLTVDCKMHRDCKSTIINVGLQSNVTINCQHNWESDTCQDMILNATNANNVIVNCVAYQACSNMNIICGKGNCLVNCNSTQGATCNNLRLTCGTGNCRINCNGDTTRCNAMNIDTNLANSFQCFGDNNDCANAPKSFTAAPVPAPITYDPTKYPSESPSKSPTYNHIIITSTITTVSIEISIISNNLTNINITNTFNDIINEYLTTRLSVNSDYYLQVDIIENTVHIKISSELVDETQLIAYIDNNLSDTQIEIIYFSTTLMDITKYRNDDEYYSNNTALIIAVIFVVLSVILLLVAAIFGYKRKKRFENKSIIELNTKIKTVGNVSIYDDDTIIHNNEDFLDDLGTEGTGSANIGERVDNEVLNEINY
eukprot:491175_1